MNITVVRINATKVNPNIATQIPKLSPVTGELASSFEVSSSSPVIGKDGFSSGISSSSSSFSSVPPGTGSGSFSFSTSS